MDQAFLHQVFLPNQIHGQASGDPTQELANPLIVNENRSPP
jgi:hypothetical protein